MNATLGNAGYSNMFLALDSEMDLAQALAQRTGRDLFAGVTDTAECKARARIQIVINKLDAELMGGRTFSEVFKSIYGEPVRAPDSPKPARKGKP